MNPQNTPGNEPLPEWIQAELERMPDPQAEELARYDHLKVGFLQAIQSAGAADVQARASGRPGFVDAVFSVAGHLLRLAEQHIRNLGPIERAQPAAVTVRGIAATDQIKQSGGRDPVGKVCKQQGDFFIEAATYKVGELVEVEVNAVHRADGSEVRPLDITVTDKDGQVITGPVHVDSASQAARFPGPAAGIYRFLVSWPGGSGEIQIEFC